MKVRRSSLGGYFVDGKRWQSVTEVLKGSEQEQFASQQIVLKRMRQFFRDCEQGLFPSSCLATINDWGGASIENAAKWLGTDEGQRWLAAGWTKETNGYKDRGTILHLFKDQLSLHPVWSDNEICEWLENTVTSEREQSKMLRDQYEEFAKSDAEGLKFLEWHDRYSFGKPQRPFDCEADDVLPYLLSLNRWWQDEAPDFIWVERVLLLSKQQVAGTADGLCTWRGSMFLADFKSRKSSGAKPLDSLQLGGYSLADRYYDKDSDETKKLDWPECRHVVFTVTPEKVYPYIVKDPKESQRLFKYELAKQKADAMFYTYHETNAMTKEQQ